MFVKEDEIKELTSEYQIPKSVISGLKNADSETIQIDLLDNILLANNQNNIVIALDFDNTLYIPPQTKVEYDIETYINNEVIMKLLIENKSASDTKIYLKEQIKNLNTESITIENLVYIPVGKQGYKGDYNQLVNNIADDFTNRTTKADVKSEQHRSNHRIFVLTDYKINEEQIHQAYYNGLKDNVDNFYKGITLNKKMFDMIEKYKNRGFEFIIHTDNSEEIATLGIKKINLGEQLRTCKVLSMFKTNNEGKCISISTKKQSCLNNDLQKTFNIKNKNFIIFDDNKDVLKNFEKFKIYSYLVNSTDGAISPYYINNEIKPIVADDSQKLTDATFFIRTIEEISTNISLDPKEPEHFSKTLNQPCKISANSDTTTTTGANDNKTLSNNSGQQL